MIMIIKEMFSKTAFRLVALALLGMSTGSAFAGAGGVDTTFNVTVNNTVYSVLTQPGGKILIGGAFTTVAGVTRSGLARLFPDGTLDTTFTNSIFSGGTVYAMRMQPNGKLLVAGSFNTPFPTHLNVARLNVDGSIDGTFTNSNPGGAVFALGLQSDGKVLIGGQFSSVGGTNRNYIARLNSDGTVDNGFNAGIISGNMVNAIALQGDGNILIGGSFNNFITYGLSRNNIARLTTNGAPDSSYQPTTTATVQSVFLQDDGKSVWCGSFTSLDSNIRVRVGRLNADGTLDSGFTASVGANNTIYAVTEDTDDNIYVGGVLSSYNGSVREGVARVFSDGTLDSSFNKTTNFITPQIRCLAIQSDGKVLAGGNFSSFNSTPRVNLVRLYGDNYPAEIITQPQGRNVAVGSNVTFSVELSNPTVADYQWRKDGVDIPGATFGQYSVFNAQMADAGNYSVFASTGLGGTTSSNALLQVGIAPVITQQPTNLTVTQGQSATFTGAATGTSLNYYWRFGQSVVGTNTTLTLTNVVAGQAGSYVFVASNFVGSATSAPATLSVLFPITLVGSPASQAVPVGGSANFTVAVTGYPLNYQWLKNGSPITGANGSNYSISNVLLTDAGGFSVIVSNQFNSVTSSVANLSVGFPPTVTVQPVSLTNNLGDTATFSCTVTGTAPIALQWLFNGNPLTNQYGTNLTLTNVQIAGIGGYALSAANAFGSTVSSNAFLNLNGYPSNLYAGLVAFYPFNGNANDASGNGNNGTVNGATLTQDRFGASGMAYQFDGISNLITCNVANIPTGATPRTVCLWAMANSMTPGEGANLAWWGVPQNLQGFGIIDNGSPSTWQGQSFGGGDDVDSGFAVDTSWHQIVVVYTGSQLSISIDGTQEASLPIAINTGTSPFLIGAGASSGFFSGAIDEVRIYNRALSSNDVQQLYMLESGLPTITQQPQSLMLVAGTTANFSVQALGMGTLSYQWFYTNAPLANATNAMLTLPSVQPANSGPYYVVVTNNFGSVPSAVANLAVGNPPQTLQFQLNSDKSLSIQMPGTPGFNYVLQTTTNLLPPVIWESIASIPADTNGVWTYMDTNTPSSGSRFYRVSTPY